MPLIDATRNYLDGNTSSVETRLGDVAAAGPPTVKGRPIWEHLPRVSQLKRDGQPRAALALAETLMVAMQDASRQDPAWALDLYVAEVAALHSAVGQYAACADVIRGWIASAPRARHADARVNLEKRLAKAEERNARREGRDPAQHKAAWQAKVAEEKALPTTPRAELTGKARAPKKVAAAKWIPSRSELLKDEFVAVDFETANRLSGVSACQVALVKVAGGEVVDQLCTYLRPPEEYIRFEFSHIHGIYRGDIEDAPSWFDIADEIVRFVGGAPVYAHNATFDASVWRGLDRYYFTGTYPEQFYCTCRMARRLLPHLADHRLPTVAEYCAPGFALEHHRADSDALACAHIVAQLQRSRGLHALLPA